MVHLEALASPPEMSQVLMCFFLLQEADLHTQERPDIVEYLATLNLL